MATAGEEWYDEVFGAIIQPGAMRRCHKCRTIPQESPAISDKCPNLLLISPSRCCTTAPTRADELFASDAAGHHILPRIVLRAKSAAIRRAQGGYAMRPVHHCIPNSFFIVVALLGAHQVAEAAGNMAILTHLNHSRSQSISEAVEPVEPSGNAVF